MSTTINLTINVIESNGIIDRDAIRSDVFCKLEMELDDRDSYKQRVAQAVNEVFNRNAPGTRFLLNHLLSKTIEALDVEPGDYSKWEKRVLEYVRDNSQGKAVNGVSERRNSLFVMGKGTKEGGVARRADLEGAAGSNSKPAEPVREQKNETPALEAAAE